MMTNREKNKIKTGREELIKFFRDNGMEKEVKQIISIDNGSDHKPGSPDFKVKLGNRDIVIELTEFFRHNGKRGSPFRMIENQCKKLEEFISNNWEKEINISGSMYAKTPRKCPNETEFKKFLTELTKLTKSSFLIKTDKAQPIAVIFSNRHTIYSRDTEVCNAKDYPTLANYLNSIVIFRNSAYIHSWTFSMVSTGSTQEFMKDIQENYIKKKNGRVETYKQRTNFDELWLLIYFNHLYSQITPPFKHLNKAIKNNINFQNICKQSGFDKIYLHFIPYKKVLEC